MIEILLNGEDCSVDSVEGLAQLLNRVATCSRCELFLSVENEPSMCMLKQGEFSWLMYLRHVEDSGFQSIGDINAQGQATFTLSNGQVDEYPVAWCIQLEQALSACSYFWINKGKRPDFIEWSETRPGNKLIR